MTRMPYLLTTSRVARHWQLPIDEARLIVSRETRHLPIRQSAWIFASQIVGLLLAWALAPMLQHRLPGWVTVLLSLLGMALYATGWLWPYLVARRRIIACADLAQRVDTHAPTTRKLASAVGSIRHHVPAE